MYSPLFNKKNCQVYPFFLIFFVKTPTMPKHGLFFILVTLFSYCGLAQTNPIYSKDIEQKIKQVETSLAGWVQMQDSSLWTLQDRMAYYHIPGVSIAVIKDYKIEWVRGYGMADSADRRTITTTTRFQAA